MRFHRSRSDRRRALSPAQPGWRLPLPAPARRAPPVRVRALLGHCLYRRLVVSALALLVLLLLSRAQDAAPARARSGARLRLGGARNNDNHRDGTIESQAAVIPHGAHDAPETEKPAAEPYHWLQYRHLDGYFDGIRAIVPYANYTPAYPPPPPSPDHPTASLATDAAPAAPIPTERAPPTARAPPTPIPFVPYPDYQSPAYLRDHAPVRPCYLDADETVPAPDIYAYPGVVQGQPEPVLGSYRVLGLRDDVCWDRFGRYGPYGLGYSQEAGGLGGGVDTERGGSEAVWLQGRGGAQISYRGVDWANAQARCLAANRARFADPVEDQSLSTVPPPPPPLAADEDPSHQSHQSNQEQQESHTKSRAQKLERVAVVVRTYVGFRWTRLAVLHFRALVSELALRSGGEYGVHFLLHVRDDDLPVWADAETAQRVLDESVPREFHGLCALWSEAQMRLLYPPGAAAAFGPAVENPSGADVHGVYRSAHLPLQHFAMAHPEYAHFWNWEMDMRWLGSYYELFDRLARWARAQSRVGLWERSHRYYVPRRHGAWHAFAARVRAETEAAGVAPVLGPVLFPGRRRLRGEERGFGALPPSCRRAATAATTATPPPPHDNETAACGVGEEADLITLNPLFDPEDSGWVFARDATGYVDPATGRPFAPPRRCAIVTASRLSWRLLAAMHEETWRHRRSMFSEMFPASTALHRGLKAAYAPHPVYLDRAWDLGAVERHFNGGRAGTTGGPGSPFAPGREHNHRGTSWYYNSEFAGLLWRRWLGYAQVDGRGGGAGGRAGEGRLRGGRAEEEGGTGRMCLRSMLVHPIKWEHPREGD